MSYQEKYTQKKIQIDNMLKKRLKFWDQKIKYTIPMNDILYVTTNTVKQKDCSCNELFCF